MRMLRVIQITNGLLNIFVSKITLYCIIVASALQFTFVSKEYYANVLYYYVIGLTVYAYIALCIFGVVIMTQLLFPGDVKNAMDVQRKKDSKHKELINTLDDVEKNK